MILFNIGILLKRLLKNPEVSCLETNLDFLIYKHHKLISLNIFNFW